MRCRAINCPRVIPLPAQATGLAPTAARRRLNSHATSCAVTTTVVATTLGALLRHASGRGAPVAQGRDLTTTINQCGDGSVAHKPVG